MKKILLLVSLSASMLANPWIEPVSSEGIGVEEPHFPDAKTPPAAIREKEAVELSLDTPRLKAPQDVDGAPLSSSSIEPIVIDRQGDLAAVIQEEKDVAEEVASSGIIIDLSQVFAGSPTIYSLLFALSIAAVGISIYTFSTLRKKEVFSPLEAARLRKEIESQEYNSALSICQTSPSFLLNMVAAAIKNRHEGAKTMLAMMQEEGRRLSTSYWQKIGILNEIAVIAPMLGLLGTVLGMFYAFYDLNRSSESISALFDGLGISVGTTIGGLIVAILSLLLHAAVKYRLMRQLVLVEKEAETLIQAMRENR